MLEKIVFNSRVLHWWSESRAFPNAAKFHANFTNGPGFDNHSRLIASPSLPRRKSSKTEFAHEGGQNLARRDLDSDRAVPDISIETQLAYIPGSCPRIKVMPRDVSSQNLMRM
jgi:hypothetical protein